MIKTTNPRAGTHAALLVKSEHFKTAAGAKELHEILSFNRHVSGLELLPDRARFRYRPIGGGDYSLLQVIAGDYLVRCWANDFIHVLDETSFLQAFDFVPCRASVAMDQIHNRLVGDFPGDITNGQLVGVVLDRLLDELLIHRGLAGRNLAESLDRVKQRLFPQEEGYRPEPSCPGSCGHAPGPGLWCPLHACIYPACNGTNKLRAGDNNTII